MADVLDFNEPTNTVMDQVLRAARSMPESRLVQTIPLGELIQFAEALRTAGVKECDMGPLCIGCTPRNPDGSCPGAASGVTEDRHQTFRADTPEERK